MYKLTKQCLGQSIYSHKYNILQFNGTSKTPNKANQLTLSDTICHSRLDSILVGTQSFANPLNWYRINL